MLNDKQWLRIAHLLPANRQTKAGELPITRRFVEAVLFHSPHRVPMAGFAQQVWELALVYVRFARWEVGGGGVRLLKALRGCRFGRVVHGCHDCSQLTSIRQALLKR